MVKQSHYSYLIGNRDVDAKPAELNVSGLLCLARQSKGKTIQDAF